MMTLRTGRQALGGLTLGILLLAAVPVAVLGQTARIWRVGFLAPGSYSSGDPRVEALRRGFRELGYTEGQNLALEFRWAQGNARRLPELAAELAKPSPASRGSPSPGIPQTPRQRRK